MVTCFIIDIIKIIIYLSTSRNSFYGVDYIFYIKIDKILDLKFRKYSELVYKSLVCLTYKFYQLYTIICKITSLSEGFKKFFFKIHIILLIIYLFQCFIL